MKCSAHQCGRDAAYKSAQLCQMHYFRMRRNGSLDKLPASRQQRVITPNGYVRVFDPAHQLTDKGGYTIEQLQAIKAEYRALVRQMKREAA